MCTEIGRKRTYNKNFPDINPVHWDVLNINVEQELCIDFISTNSQYKQGIRLAVDVGDGYFEIDGKNYGKQIRLWEDTCPSKVHIKCVSTEGLLSVYNIYDKGKNQGGIRSQMDSCAMIVERTNSKILYKCNDVGFVSNFDKLIFQIEFL